MKLRTQLFLTALTMLMTPVCKAYTTGDGICHTVGGANIYNLNLNGKQIPADKNKANTEVRDLETLSASTTYKAQCDCLTHFTTTFRTMYYTARSTLSTDRVINGYTYYRLSDNLSIATSVQVLGRDFIPVPFTAEPNKMTHGTYCYAPGEEGDEVTLDTGSKIQVSFLINKPFIGRISVPGTVVADLYGGLDEASSTASTDKMAEIRIVGDIVVPQNCEIAPGQTLEIDFGKIPATDFSSTKGAAVSGRKVKKTIQVQCTGMLDEDIVYSTFRADPVDADAMMMKVNGNDDVGITVYDKWDRQVNVNGGKMDMDKGINTGGAENNSLTFSAAPASATGAQPKPGAFEAYATITLEIEH